MKTLARILILALTLFFLGIGLTMLFNPALAADRASLLSTGPQGLSTLRGVLGGSYIMIGIFLGTAAWKTQKDGLLVPGVFLVILVIGRLLSWIIDGSGPQTILAIVLEMVFFAIVVFGYITFQKDENSITSK